MNEQERAELMDRVKTFRDVWVDGLPLSPDEKEYVGLMKAVQRGLDRYWYEHVQRMKLVQSTGLYPQRESKRA